MIVEIAEARAMFEAAHRYLAGQSTIQELNGRASTCAAAAHSFGGHPAIKQIAEDWMAVIDRRWNEFGHVTHPLCEIEFRNWLLGQLLP